MSDALHPFVRELLTTIVGSQIPAEAMARALHALPNERDHVDLIFVQLALVYERFAKAQVEPISRQLHQLLALYPLLDSERSGRQAHTAGKQLQTSGQRMAPTILKGLQSPKTEHPKRRGQ